MTKKCNGKCGLIKKLNTENFHPRKKSKDGFDTYCRECRKERNLNNYHKNQKSWRQTHTKTRLEKKEKIQEIKKSKQCLKCEESRFYLLDFHHIDPKQKSFQISQGESKGWDAVEKEIGKCLVLCKNCHAEFHYMKNLNNITIEEYLNGK